MAAGFPAISILLFAWSLADFIFFPPKAALPKTSPVSQIRWNNRKRRKEGGVSGIKPCQVLHYENSLKSGLFLEGSYFLVNRKAVALYFSEQK